ncbi:MAG: alanine--tRNA ligase [Chloroflexi bacterium]|nr:alanine--tRNA ligase [Chloroflexota bacterium]
MTADEIRSLFLSFFESKGHKILPSSSLVPYTDPTLLLTTAGMVQIKPYFLGEATPPSPRLASCQKCFRTTDIDSVGDARHLTFFEMLGNFSVGDYFKEEAINWGWEFVTRRLGMPRERLLVSVFRDDDEAFNYWRKIGFPEEKIFRCGEKDNFWGPAGDSGPCGPCSEIHWDCGNEYGCDRVDCGPGCGCGRFVEIWNLVFTQFNQDKQGRRTPLPKPNIDTGMGLERVAMVLQGKRNVYQCDLFAPIVGRIKSLSPADGLNGETAEKAVKIVAEHGRGAVFLISDGVIPSNEGRGYVLRRILRRSMALGKRLGLPQGFLNEVGQTVINKMGGAYPDLVSNRDYIHKVIRIEEERFDRTIDLGLGILEGIMAGAKSRNISAIAGTEVFRLYDTYGFPAELTAEIAAEQGLAIDAGGFEKEMTQQKERARAAAKFGTRERTFLADYNSLALPPTQFVGYETTATEAKVLFVAAEGGAEGAASQGQEVEVVLDITPFYGEKGGQVADTGRIAGSDGWVEVADVQWARSDIIVHRGKVGRGQLRVGETVRAEVSPERRLDIARNHTATHLIQAALRQVLGQHVRQSGSLVDPDKLRFDFSQMGEVSGEQLRSVQRLVNERIRDNAPVQTEVLPYNEALARGATAIFEEKYGETVRLVKIGEPSFSQELCGGTHLKSTGQIGPFYVISEGSIGSGLRRLEAATGRGAELYAEERMKVLDRLSEELKVSCPDLPARVCALVEDFEEERKKSAALEKELARRDAESLLGRVVQVDGLKVLAARVSVSSPETLREIGDLLRDRLQSGVVVLGALINDKPSFIAMVTPDLVKRGFHAGDIIKKVARVAGGGGGGKADMAQAGARDKEKLEDALAEVKAILKKAVS